MNEPSSSSPPAVVVRRKGLGCAPTGCIVLVVILMLVGVGAGAMLWLFSQGGEAFVQDKPAAIRTADASDAAYQTVLDKLAPFGQAMSEGRPATVELTPEEFNVLAARSPLFQFVRGKVYLEAQNDHLSAELSTRVGYEGGQARYFNGRATFDASYASNGFVLFLRRLTPLKAEEGATRFGRFVNKESTLAALSQEIGRSVNDNLRRQARKDPFTADLLRRLRTVVVRDGKIVATTGDAEAPAPSPTPEETPTPAPVAGTPDQA